MNHSPSGHIVTGYKESQFIAENFAVVSVTLRDQYLQLDSASQRVGTAILRYGPFIFAGVGIILVGSGHLYLTMPRKSRNNRVVITDPAIRGAITEAVISKCLAEYGRIPSCAAPPVAPAIAPMETINVSP